MAKNGGVFAVARTMFDHKMFSQKREYSRLEAWLWLLSDAAWKGYEKRVSGHTIAVQRGQVCASIRFMAEAWGWHAAKVQRFIDALKTEAMIDTEAIHGHGIITICNYNEYQRVALPEKSDTDTPIDTAAIQQRYKLEEGETRKEEKDTLRGADAPAGSASPEAELYRVGKSVLGKSAGGVITNLRKACEYDDAYALTWIEQANEKENPMEWLQAVLKAQDPDGAAYRGVMKRQPLPAIESKADREWKRQEAAIYRDVH